MLMAAGTASRFGDNKLLHEIDGRSLLARATQAAPACLFTRAVAVVGTEQTAAIVESAGYTALRNPAPERGQGSTIVLGMRAMMDVDAALFCVADQPYLTRASVERLLAAYRPGDICALAYGGRRGNPILFPKECFVGLASLASGQTGRAVLAQHMDRLRLIEATDARELLDVDTREDLRQITDR